MKFPVTLIIDDTDVVVWAEVEIPSRFKTIPRGGRWRCKTIEIGPEEADPIPGADMTYLVRNGRTNLYKIGHTTDLKVRLSTHRTGNPDSHYVSICPGGRPYEKELHKKYFGEQYGLEWYELAPELVMELRYEMWLRRNQITYETSDRMAPKRGSSLPISNIDLTKETPALPIPEDEYIYLSSSEDEGSYSSSRRSSSPYSSSSYSSSNSSSRPSSSSYSSYPKSPSGSSSAASNPSRSYDDEKDMIKDIPMPDGLTPAAQTSWSKFVYRTTPFGRIITVAGTRITDSDIPILVQILDRAPDTLEIIDLKGSIDDSGTIMIAKYLLRDTRIQYLILSHNMIGNKGGQAIALLIKFNKTIKFVLLRNNQIGDLGGVALAEAFKVNGGIVEMDLRRNKITPMIRRNGAYKDTWPGLKLK